MKPQGHSNQKELEFDLKPLRRALKNIQRDISISSIETTKENPHTNGNPHSENDISKPNHRTQRNTPVKSKLHTNRRPYKASQSLRIENPLAPSELPEFSSKQHSPSAPNPAPKPSRCISLLKRPMPRKKPCAHCPSFLSRGLSTQHCPNH